MHTYAIWHNHCLHTKSTWEGRERGSQYEGHIINMKESTFCLHFTLDRQKKHTTKNKQNLFCSEHSTPEEKTETNFVPKKGKIHDNKIMKESTFCFTKFKESYYMWSRSSWPMMRSYTITIFPKYVYKYLSCVLIHLCTTSVPDSTIRSLDWSTRLLLRANWYPPADI